MKQNVAFMFNPDRRHGYQIAVALSFGEFILESLFFPMLKGDNKKNTKENT